MNPNKQIQKLYTERASLYQWLFVDFLGWGRELETFFRKSSYLRPDSKTLDAGCGTGIITRILYQLAQEKNYPAASFHAFDLTPQMLGIFRRWITERQATRIETQQADVLELAALPSHWTDYDLIISSTMLEYLPRHQVKTALSNLKVLLKQDGTLLVFLTRRNPMTRWLAETWWKTNTYAESETRMLFQSGGFDHIQFRPFSPGWSNSIMVIEARK